MKFLTLIILTSITSGLCAKPGGRIRPQPSQLTGQLTPFQLWIDGKRVKKDRRNATLLQINKQKVTAEAKVPHRFTMEINVPVLNIVTTFDGNSPVTEHSALQLPWVGKVSVRGPNLYVYKSRFDYLEINQTRLKIADANRVVWPLDQQGKRVFQTLNVTAYDRNKNHRRYQILLGIADLDLLSFAVQQVTYYQHQLRASSTAFQVDWTPMMRLGNFYFLRPEIGLTAIKDIVSKKTVAVLGYGFQAGSAHYYPFTLSIGLGAQTWFDKTTVFSAGFDIAREIATIKFIERFQIGYRTLFLPRVLTHEFKIGFGYGS